MAEEREIDLSVEEQEEKLKGKDLLIDVETYLKSGAQIGTKFKSGYMRKYVFRRKDGLMGFDISELDSRIRMAAKIIAKYKGPEVAVVARRLYGHKPAKKLADLIGAKSFVGRFVPGTFTNPQARSFYEPKIIFVTDPFADSQAIAEASDVNAVVIVVAGSETPVERADLILPANNKGRKALALIFFLLAREVLLERKEITSREAFTAKPSDFEQEIEEVSEEKPARRGFGSRGAGSSRGFRDSRGGSSSGSRGGSSSRGGSGSRGGNGSRTGGSRTGSRRR
jgi:small subunit ribosomal protein S2